MCKILSTRECQTSWVLHNTILEIEDLWIQKELTQIFLYEGIYAPWACSTLNSSVVRAIIYSTHADHKIRDLPWRCIKQDSSTAFHFSFTLPSKMKEGGTNYYILSLMVFLLAGKISWVNFAGQPNLNSAFLRDKWIRKFFSYSGTFILFFKEKPGR